MGFLDRFRRASPSDLRQPRPTSLAGSGWAVSRYLIDLDIRDPGAADTMTTEQRTVLSVNLLRQEVASGGLWSFFDYSPQHVDGAVRGLPTISSRLGRILEDAIALRKDGDAIDPEDQDTLDALDALDDLFYPAEAEESIDDRVDAYIAGRPAGFFK